MTMDELFKSLSDGHKQKALLLSGVDQGEIPPGTFGSWNDGAANCIVFVVNDVAYCVSEDPNDGYRSSMRDDVGVLPAALVRNRFAPVAVTVERRTRRAESIYGGECDILEFSDAATAKPVLAVGMDNTDDYYPSFVADWMPQNLSVNAGVAAMHHRDRERPDDGQPRPRRGMSLGGLRHDDEKEQP